MRAVTQALKSTLASAMLQRHLDIGLSPTLTIMMPGRPVFIMSSSPDAARSGQKRGDPSYEDGAKALRSLFTCLTLSSFGLSLAIALLQFSLPVYTMVIFDRVIPTASLSTLLSITALVVVILAISSCVEACRAELFSRASARLARIGRVHIIAAQLPVSVGEVHRFLKSRTAIALSEIPSGIIYMATLFLVDTRLGWLVTVVCFGLAGLCCVGALRADASASDVYSLGKRLSALTPDARNSRPGRANGSVRSSRFMALVAENTQSVKPRHRQAFFDAIYSGLRAVMYIGTLGLAAALVVRSEIEPGALMATTILFNKAILPFERVFAGFPSVLRSLRASRTLFGSFAVSGLEGWLNRQIPAQLKVENVSLNLEAHPNYGLFDIDLSVNAGEVIVLVGESRSGKSVLLALMAGAMRPDAGKVTFGDVPLVSLSQNDLDNIVSVYKYEVPVMLESIAAAIANGFQRSPEEVVLAAERAGLHTVIGSLPNGYHTVLEHDGQILGFSGRRKLALAQCFCSMAPVVILDDPFMGLDEADCHKLMTTFEVLRTEGRAVVVTTNRGDMFDISNWLVILSGGHIEQVVPGGAGQASYALHTAQ